MPGLAQCKKCGAELTSGFLRFCTKCGAPLPDNPPEQNADNVVQISHNIVVGGKVAFAVGENVEVEKIEPNPQRPEYKYVVYSPRLQQRFQLSDSDIKIIQQTPPPHPVQHTVHRPPNRIADLGWRKVAVIGVAALVVVSLILGFTIGLSGGWTNTGGPGYTTEALAYDSVDNVLYAGTGSSGNNYGVWNYYGATWTKTGGVISNSEEDYDVRALIYDSTHHLLYAGTRGGVWKYDGTNWTNTGGEVSSDDIYSLAYDSTHNLLYAGTDPKGVWKYNGTNWSNTDLTGTIDSLAYDSTNNVLYAGTDSNGVWKYKSHW